MKKLLGCLCLLALVLPLGGCTGIYANTREVEDLLVIRTMGLDDDPAGVRLTLASGASADGAPLRLEGRGPSVTAAMESIRSRANEEDLFCSHIGHVLIGEASARQGLDRALAYLCRAPELRLSVPVYVLRGGAAGDAVLGTGDERYGICDALDSVDGDVKLRGDGSLTTAADVARDLARRGSALICAVEALPSAEKGAATEETQEDTQADAQPTLAPGEGPAPEAPTTVAAAGYGVLKDGRLCAYLSREQAVAVGLLLGETGPCELLVAGADDAPVTLTLEGGGAVFRPVWAEDGSLERLEIDVRVRAAVAEGAAEADALGVQLERALSERMASVLRVAKREQADFLGLGERFELADPLRFRALETPFAKLLSGLPIRLSVSAKVVHSNDLEAVP